MTSNLNCSKANTTLGLLRDYLMCEPASHASHASQCASHAIHAIRSAVAKGGPGGPVPPQFFS